MYIRLVIFLLINFAALGIGGLFTSSGVTSDWYQQMNKAPWTPPGWIFGAAWFSIMICFSIYMAMLWQQAPQLHFQIAAMFALQWILNVGWNPVFFKFHQTTFALFIIIALTILVGIFLFHFLSSIKWNSLLILPYFIWLLIATTLNAYSVWKN
jgi:tryptophan-rich sensory protein